MTRRVSIGQGAQQALAGMADQAHQGLFGGVGLHGEQLLAIGLAIWRPIWRCASAG
jgi:hypothetical protein